MNRHLAALFVALEVLDFATYVQAPHLEANPVMGALSPLEVAIAKTATVVAALFIVSLIRPQAQPLALAFGIAIAAFGVGANVATLSIVAAAEDPRPAQEPAPIGDEPTGYEQVVMATAAPGRTAAPSTSAAGPSPSPSPATDTRVAPVRVVPDRAPLRDTVSTTAVPRGNAVRGRASWYSAHGLIAAAGPGLRARLGAGWRGQVVTVCASSCIRVALTDWCECYRGEGRERLIDLSDDAFRRLGPLSRGILRVRVVP